jgi:hypothetical protein
VFSNLFGASNNQVEYIGGHNDVLAGVVTVKDDTLAEQLGQFHNMIGATLSTMSAPCSKGVDKYGVKNVLSIMVNR